MLPEIDAETLMKAARKELENTQWSVYFLIGPEGTLTPQMRQVDPAGYFVTPRQMDKALADRGEIRVPKAAIQALGLLAA